MVQLAQKPWYQRTKRWGQTNLTEMDPSSCDIKWWRNYWKESKIQGLIINAGGIVAYYPSKYELQYQAKAILQRDLFGEFSSAARKEGLTVVARMDVNRADRRFYETHPDWFALDAEGQPYTSNGRYFSCVNSDYYKSYIPQILEEIYHRYQPDGFADNSWTGISRQRICYCENCKTKFKHDHDFELPRKMDWDDPIYRTWVRWSYQCRTENWDLFNQITQQVGGDDCLWVGMVHGTPFNHHSFCHLKDITERTKIVFCDHQSRNSVDGFEQNGISGNLLHQLMDRQCLVTESMANYVRGMTMFRKASNPPKETQMWMIEGISGGISPWYHHIGAVHEDLRQFKNMPALMKWHESNEAYLYDRECLANVGLVWSEDNSDFYGRNEIHERVILPWRGFAKALIRTRIPFIPVHADHIERDSSRLDVLILPDLAVMSDEQAAAIRRFVEKGGSIVYTGATGMLDKWGELKHRSSLEALTGIKQSDHQEGALTFKMFDLEVDDAHNYIRLNQANHPITNHFHDTSILPFGGKLQKVQYKRSLQSIATYIPKFPIYPPEFSWMRTTETDLPVVLAGEHSSGGRIVYFAGDLDRCYGRMQIPDHGDLLSAAVLWAAKDQLPIRVEGPGTIDCKIFKQNNRLIIHLVNLSGVNQWPGYLEENLPVGPIRISLMRDAYPLKTAYLKVSGKEQAVSLQQDWMTFSIDRLVDHELAVLE